MFHLKGSHNPIAKGPLYTGNPYGNILILSWIWHGINQSAKIMNIETPIGTDPFTLSKIGRAFYILLSVITVLLLFFLSEIIFKSLLISFLSAFFFAVSPLAIGLTHTIKPELPLTFFLTLSAFFAILLVRKKKTIYYILGGIFAGIATAMKYNGLISLLFLFLIHLFITFEEHKEKPIRKKMALSLLSPHFLLSIFVWGIFFYTFEPVLWHNWKTGLNNIRSYLHVAAFVGMPGYLYGHPLKILAYNLKCAPGNFIMFLKCAQPYIIVLSFIGILSSRKRKIIWFFALFPTLILLILFLTKSLFGEEYLLHPLPFIYILAGVGCQTLIKLFSKKRVREIISFSLIALVMVIGLYDGFKEAKYASIGNIRYYASEWAVMNLKGHCVHQMLHTLLPRYKFCNHNPSVFVVCSPKTYKKNYTLPDNSILLKTFLLETEKPLLHHLRGHHIRFFALKGKPF